MQLEIISPERVICDAEVSSLSVPGVDGEFQMLENHAPIVSVLEKGYIRLNPKTELDEDQRKNFFQSSHKPDQLYLEVKGGVVEMKANKAVVLVD